MNSRRRVYPFPIDLAQISKEEDQRLTALTTNLTNSLSLPSDANFDPPELPENWDDIDLPRWIDNFRRSFGTCQCKVLAQFMTEKLGVSVEFLNKNGLHEAQPTCTRVERFWVPSPATPSYDFAMDESKENEEEEAEEDEECVGGDDDDDGGDGHEDGAETASSLPGPKSTIMKTKTRKKAKCKEVRQRASKNRWSEKESLYLQKLVKTSLVKPKWKSMAQQVNLKYGGQKTGPSAAQHYNRVVLKNDTESNWSLEEERALQRHIQSFSGPPGKWRDLSRQPEVHKTDVECRYFWRRFYSLKQGRPNDCWTTEQVSIVQRMRTNSSWTEISHVVNQVNSQWKHSPLQCQEKSRTLPPPDHTKSSE